MEQVVQKRLSVSGGSWITIDAYGNAAVPGLVIVPGSFSDAREWRGVASAITAWPSVTVVNRRGRSPSGRLANSYSVQTEVEDLRTMLDAIGGASVLFGWSYGALIVLRTARELRGTQIIGYEPVMKPFGEDALPALGAATESEDWSRSVELALRQIGGVSEEDIDRLRSDSRIWSHLCRLSMPSYAELLALNSDSESLPFVGLSSRVDLIIGELSRYKSPYGTAFGNVRANVDNATVHELKGQGHLAHIQAPDALALLIDSLAMGPPQAS